MFRAHAARQIHQNFARLQQIGILPDPRMASATRRLGEWTIGAPYSEQITGSSDPSVLVETSAARQDEEAGNRYAALLAQSCGPTPSRPYGFFRVPQVKVWPGLGVHSSAAGNFIDVYCGDTLSNPKYELPRLALPAIPATREIQKAVFFGPAWFNNYYHWMIDILPRLQLVPEMLSSGMPLLCPPRMNDARMRSMQLALTSIDAADVEIIVPDANITLVRDLVMPTRMTHSLDVSARQWEFVRKAILPVAEAGRRGRRLYISRRSDAKARRITNETEILPILERRGFEFITMSGRTIENQAGLFADAEAVVSHHGAALTNVLFCEPGTKFIEIFQDGHFGACFARLAKLGSLDYGFLVGRRVGADTWVDPVQLERVLDRSGL